MTAEAALTEVEAHVDPTREAVLMPAFQAMLDKVLPPGLVRTQLLRGRGNLWRSQSLWKDQGALDAMRPQTQRQPRAPAARSWDHCAAQPRSVQPSSCEAAAGLT